MPYIKFKKFNVSTATLNKCHSEATKVKGRIADLKAELDQISIGQFENIVRVNEVKIKDIDKRISQVNSDQNSYEISKGFLSKVFNSKQLTKSAKTELDSLYSEKIKLEDQLHNASASLRTHSKISSQIDWLENYLKPIERRIEKVELKKGKEVEKKKALSEKIKSEKEKHALQLLNEKQRKKKEIEELRARVELESLEKRKQFDRQKRKIIDHGNCPYCGIEFNSLSSIHTDHIWPISKGGTNHTSNLVNICSGCNLKKGKLTLREFIKKYNLDYEEIELRLEFLNKTF